MPDIIANNPYLAFFICFFGALFTWLAAEQFRDQILSDTHRVVRTVALRYLQIMVGAFALFAIGTVLAGMASLGALFQSANQALLPPEDPTVVEETTPASLPEFQQELFPNLPTVGFDSTPAAGAPPPGDVPTAQPVPTSELAGVRTALIINTTVGVNVRDVPGMGGAVLQVAPEGTRVTILGDTQEADTYTWYQIVLPDGTRGWVASNFLDFEGQ